MSTTFTNDSKESLSNNSIPHNVIIKGHVGICPRLCERIAVVIFPLVERLAVEQQLPAVGGLGFGEHILGRRARNARRKQQRETARPGESAAKIGSR